MTFKISEKGTVTCSYPQCTFQSNTLKKCSSCLKVMYCGTACQKADWKHHRLVCKALDKRVKPLKHSYEIEEFSDRDLHLLGLSKEKIREFNDNLKHKDIAETFSKKTLSCFNFALLEVGEAGVLENILTINDRPLKVQMEENLKKWGYTAIQSPKSGDLVLYSDKDDLKHMGIYKGHGQVLSKCGNAVHYATFFPVEALCSLYKSTATFYRKIPLQET